MLCQRRLLFALLLSSSLLTLSLLLLTDNAQQTWSVEPNCTLPNLAVAAFIQSNASKLISDTLINLERAMLLRSGGLYWPQDCDKETRASVAIIIPYRDREQHLKTFLAYMHYFLMGQRLKYKIYVVSQKMDKVAFNRGALFNAGFLQAMKDEQWDCVVFHDVDLLPEQHRNLYICDHRPKLLISGMSTFKYKLPYATYFGGVSALRPEQFRAINGFANSFYGWGGEDDDLMARVKKCNQTNDKVGTPQPIGRYVMLGHKKAVGNPTRMALLYSGPQRFATDGLSNMSTVKVVDVVEQRLYTNITVQLDPREALALADALEKKRKLEEAEKKRRQRQRIKELREKQKKKKEEAKKNNKATNKKADKSDNNNVNKSNYAASKLATATTKKETATTTSIKEETNKSDNKNNITVATNNGESKKPNEKVKIDIEKAEISRNNSAIRGNITVDA